MNLEWSLICVCDLFACVCTLGTSVYNLIRRTCGMTARDTLGTSVYNLIRRTCSMTARDTLGTSVYNLIRRTCGMTARDTLGTSVYNLIRRTCGMTARDTLEALVQRPYSASSGGKGFLTTRFIDFRYLWVRTNPITYIPSGNVNKLDVYTGRKMAEMVLEGGRRGRGGGGGGGGRGGCK